jgi:integrase
MNAKIKITDALLQKLKREPVPGDYMDAALTCFGIRVSPKGKIAFFLYAKLPGYKSATRHGLGAWCPPVFTLAMAREKAVIWKGQIGQGKNPKAEIRQRKLEIAEEKQKTFAAAIPQWEKFKLRNEKRRANPTRRRVKDLERDACSEWGEWPLLKLSQSRSAIKNHLVKIGIERGQPAAANRLHITLKSIFDWAINEEEDFYGIDVNPCASIRQATYGYKRSDKARPFTEDEIKALWAAAGSAGYPWGYFFKFLLLTSARNGETVQAAWSEIDIEKKLWTVPPEHAKMGKEIRRPLSDAAIDLLNMLPRDAESAAALIPEANGRRASFLKFYDPTKIFGMRPMNLAYGTQSCRSSPKRGGDRVPKRAGLGRRGN